MLLCFFFFKQKTAYEMRISDWSSDVCSSDLSWSKAVAARMLVARARRLGVDAAVRWFINSLLRRGMACRSKARPEARRGEKQVDSGRHISAQNGRRARFFRRSEEHTSELQSLMRNSADVFCFKTKQTKN